MQILLICFAFINGINVISSATVYTLSDNHCLNGLRDYSGKCVCGLGYALYRGNCVVTATQVNTEPRVRTRSNSICPTGSRYSNGRCTPTVCTGTFCDSSCPPGYVLKQGFCEIPNPRCPPGTSFQNGFCYYQPILPEAKIVSPVEKVKTVSSMKIAIPVSKSEDSLEIIEATAPMRIDLPVPEFHNSSEPTESWNDSEDTENIPDRMRPTIDPLDPNEAREEKHEDIVEFVPNRRPLNASLPKHNVVNNVNTVNAPTNVSTHNVNNVFIHIARSRSDGTLKTVVIRNNETAVYGDQPLPKESEEYETEEITTEVPAPCCTIVSPRICRKQEQDEWVCFHRKHYRCGSFCTSDVIYLKPQMPELQNSHLIMPPMMGYSPLMRYGVCRWGICPPVDCSGCLHGKYRCHFQCYTYDCAQQGRCNFIRQDEFCSGNEDEICAAVD